MKRGLFSDIVATIDIGTTKIFVIIARYFGNESFEIIGIGQAPSQGLKKGMVVDIAQTVHSIKQAVAEAQLMAGCTIDSAVIGISGSHIQSFTSQAVVPIKKGEVTQADIDHVLSFAKAVAIGEDQQILHVLPQYYRIDGQEQLYQPLGMYGVRLEVYAHVITGSVASVQNLIKCCQMAGIAASDIVLEQLASAQAVLSADERQMGVGIVDIGGGTCDVAIYQHGAIKFTAVIPVAGNQFTNDVAVGLHTTISQAEQIKKEYGCLFLTKELEDRYFMVESIGGGSENIFIDQLISILRPRTIELLQLVKQIIDKNNLHSFITAGFVLTGGGALLTGLPLLAQQLLKVPVRIGKPRVTSVAYPTIEHPMYATGYGLLLCAVKKRDTANGQALTLSTISRLAIAMKSWISDLF
jgi:cell division protein FtsA